MIFLDTPGLLEPSYRLHETMGRQIDRSARDADVILLLVDGSRPRNRIDLVSSFLERTKAPVVAALNKIDTIPEDSRERVAAAVASDLGLDSLRAVSAVTGENVPPLLAELEAALPLGARLYPDEVIADQPERFFAGELVREAAFEQLSEELPYAIAVDVDDFRDPEAEGLRPGGAASAEKDLRQRGPLRRPREPERDRHRARGQHAEADRQPRQGGHRGAARPRGVSRAAGKGAPRLAQPRPGPEGVRIRVVRAGFPAQITRRPLNEGVDRRQRWAGARSRLEDRPESARIGNLRRAREPGPGRAGRLPPGYSRRHPFLGHGEAALRDPQAARLRLGTADRPDGRRSRGCPRRRPRRRVRGRGAACVRSDRRGGAHRNRQALLERADGPDRGADRGPPHLHRQRGSACLHRGAGERRSS